MSQRVTENKEMGPTCLRNVAVDITSKRSCQLRGRIDREINIGRYFIHPSNCKSWSEFLSLFNLGQFWSYPAYSLRKYLRRLDTGLIYIDSRIKKQNTKWVIQSLTIHYQQGPHQCLQFLKALLSGMALEGKEKQDIIFLSLGLGLPSHSDSFPQTTIQSHVLSAPHLQSVHLTCLYIHWLGNVPFYGGPQTGMGPGGHHCLLYPNHHPSPLLSLQRLPASPQTLMLYWCVLWLTKMRFQPSHHPISSLLTPLMINHKGWQLCSSRRPC